MKLFFTAASALTVLSASPALAFDTINWNWDADVQTNIAVDALANVEVNPTGMATVEGDQDMKGSLTATSALSAIENDISTLDPSTLDDILATESKGSGIGNNATIASDVAVNYDLNQTYGGLSVPDPLGLEPAIAIAGLINATASSADIVNATVDNDATGVANNISVELLAGSPDDSFLVGNSTQSAMADITSASTVSSINFDGVSGLGTLENPGVSSAATALGNSLDVEVGKVTSP